MIGDTVNIAARLAAAGKEFGSRILASERTWTSAADHFDFREVAITLRRRYQAERIFELLGG